MGGRLEYLDFRNQFHRYFSTECGPQQRAEAMIRRATNKIESATNVRSPHSKAETRHRYRVHVIGA